MKVDEVRNWIVEYLSQRVERAAVAALHEGTDLVAEGIVDSMGLLHLIAEMEDTYSVELDFEDVEPADLTKFGFLCRYVAEQMA